MSQLSGVDLKIDDMNNRAEITLMIAETSSPLIQSDFAKNHRNINKKRP
jgi:hypothetical protein